ncbi:MAG: metallophosphoesterase family protein [Anaerolineales bacterium]
MKIAILSDLHANRPALVSVLQDADRQGVEEFWALGDFVGYGPHPVNILLFLKRYVHPDAWVMGNHDAMLADLLTPEEVPHTRGAHPVQTAKGEGPTIYTRGKFLSDDEWYKTTATPIEALLKNRSALAAHPEADAFWRAVFTPERAVPRLVERDGLTCSLVHASLRDPLSRYLYPWEDAVLLPREFASLDGLPRAQAAPALQFYGHSHVPSFISAERGPGGEFRPQALPVFPNETQLLQAGIYLINPGSVGQPRDRDPRAAYLLFDTQIPSVTFRRVEYDYAETARDLLDAEYPESLVRRLRSAQAAESQTPNAWLQHYDEARKRMMDE